MKNLRVAAVLAALAGCSSSPPDSDPRPAPADPLAPAPWQAAAVAAPAVPSVLITEWSRAENRATCAPIAFTDLGAGGQDATPRAATFAGGWAVAYDLPRLRSAFGVAGTGVKAADPSYDEWPFKRQWADGSTVGYGPEGGTGTKQLAYLRIAGQGCLYNVWSQLGRSHLESLLESLRFADTGA